MIILYLLFGFGVLISRGADSSEAALAAAKTLLACQQAGQSCRVTYQETTTGWLWKNGVPVNSSTTTVTREVKAPAPPPPPAVVVYPGTCSACVGVVVVNR